LILGVLGCCFGILGIFTLGLVFVPFGVLFSLLSLMAGLVNRSTVGTIAGIGGLTFSAIGFFSSPTLVLLSSFLAISQSSRGSTTIAPQQAASAPATTTELPQQEQKFCDITSVASTRYFSLARDARKAHDEKNGILEKRAEDAMTSTAHGR